jgi:hypothetical protein
MTATLILTNPRAAMQESGQVERNPIPDPIRFLPTKLQEPVTTRVGCPHLSPKKYPHLYKSVLMASVSLKAIS